MAERDDDERSGEPSMIEVQRTLSALSEHDLLLLQQEIYRLRDK